MLPGAVLCGGVGWGIGYCAVLGGAGVCGIVGAFRADTCESVADWEVGVVSGKYMEEESRNRQQTTDNRQQT